MAVEDLIPPDDLNFVGAGGFLTVGQEFFKYFVDLARLQPHEHVLDVGCGIGRMAVPLTQYLNETGRYDGFDVVPRGIDWCREKITPRYPNFHFQLADLRNKYYSPHASTPARHFRFPYRTASFDFVFLTSVFTHLLPPDMENYVYEVARVLKPSGRCLATFFLLNPESRDLNARGQGTMPFPHELPSWPCRILETAVPERAVAQDESFAIRMFARYGLAPNQPVRYGHWCGRKKYTSFQDLVVLHQTRPLLVSQRILRACRRSLARWRWRRAAA